MEWHCFKDYRRMVEVDLELENLEDHHKFFHKGLKCPHCGLAFITLDWFCFRDKVAIEEADVKLVYHLSEDFSPNFTVKGLKCLKCSAAYLSENVAVTRLSAAESKAEGK